jgi:hypothetical protein
MADNLNVTEGSGRRVRALELPGGAGGTVLVQYVGLVTAVPTVVGVDTMDVTGSTTLTVPSGATHALACVDVGGGDIRFWEDGSVPSATEGLLIQAGETAELTNLSDITMFPSAGTVTVNISYRRYDQ